MQTTIYQQDQKKYIDVVREKVSLYGKKNASLHELLAVIIGNSAKPEVCGRLSSISIRDLLAMTASDFILMDGITKTVAERLEAALALATVVNEQRLPDSPIIQTPEDAYQIFKYLQHEEQEQFVVAFLNTKKELIGKECIFKGTLDASLVHPRDIFRLAIQKSAKSIIICHQHPSGNPYPSDPDIEITKSIVKSGQILGIDVDDHIIIGDGVFLSLGQKGFMDTPSDLY